MTLPRNLVLDNDVESTFHCYSRCTRKAFLFIQGDDPKNDYSHRREWVRNRKIFLADIFTIDVLGYALLSNHMHGIYRIRPDLRDALTDEEVIRRWKRLYPGKKDKHGKTPELTPEVMAALLADTQRVRDWRERLGSLSWYMKALKEPLAKMANLEDGCTGHFFEQRFKSQPLCDDTAILTALIYVDLNPIRARMAQTPENSDFTSAQDRIKARQAKELIELAAKEIETNSPTEQQQQLILEQVQNQERDAWLTPIQRNQSDPRKGALPMSLDEYLALLDWSGRQIQAGKAGVIPADLAPILTRLEINAAHWIQTIKSFGSWFHRVVGKVESMAQAAKRLGFKWFQGIQKSKIAFAAKAD